MKSEFQSRNPEFERVVRQSFDKQAMMSTLGATLTRVEAGRVDIEMAFDARFTQQDGYLHAGAVATIADSANGYAALSLAPAGTEVLAVEFKINLVRPVVGDRIVARGRVIRPGSSLTACMTEVYAQREGSSKLVALALGTIMLHPSA